MLMLILSFKCCIQVQETPFRVDKLPVTDDMVRVWAKLTGLAGAGFKQEKDKLTNITQHPNGVYLSNKKRCVFPWPF